MLSVILLMFSCAQAWETDQFTPPKGPLHDIGVELSMKAVIVAERMRDGNTPAESLYNAIGKGLPTSTIEAWVAALKSEEAPVRFTPKFFESIYFGVLSPIPASFAYTAPTVSVYGSLMGTDKIGHFFQQGYEYFQIYNKARAEGKSEAEAQAACVAHGVMTEEGYFGTAFTGVFSNADLAANFAGLKFYRNLTEAVRIGDRIKPPILVPTGGTEPHGDQWRWADDLDPAEALRPFFSDHFDEALNPCDYHLSRDLLRHAIHERCEPWKKYYGEKAALAQPVSTSWVRLWNGEEYGHTLAPERELSMATLCD